MYTIAKRRHKESPHITQVSNIIVSSVGLIVCVCKSIYIKCYLRGDLEVLNM